MYRSMFLVLDISLNTWWMLYLLPECQLFTSVDETRGKLRYSALKGGTCQNDQNDPKWENSFGVFSTFTHKTRGGNYV